jgi:hypothetical protein
MLVDQIHVFNSFFFKKLDGGRGKACDYNSVKKWTSKIDLFKKKFVIVPINEQYVPLSCLLGGYSSLCISSLHWYLAIICFPEHVLRAPPPKPASQSTRKTRSSDGGTTKPEEPRASQESDMPNSSIIDVEAGSPVEMGQMEVDTDLANRSQNMIIDVEMTPVTPDVRNDKDAESNGPPSTPPVLDMTNDGPDDETDDSGNAYVLFSYSNPTI